MDLDTSDATATAEDMASDVTAYVSGEKIQGAAVTLPKPESPIFRTYQVKNDPAILVETSRFKFDAIINENVHFRPDGIVEVVVQSDKFGDATAADVAEGKTFTSSAGLKVLGTLRELQSGLNDVSESVHQEGNRIYAALRFGGTWKVPINTVINVGTLSREFGDATAADVASGKTFTSAAGLKVVGTAEFSSESGIYVWTKHNVGTKSSYTTSTGTTSYTKPSDADTSMYYKSYTLDPETGVFTLTGGTTTSTSGYYVKSTSGDDVIYLYKNQMMMSTYQKISSTLSGSTPCKGDTCYGVVTSESETAYPEDGQQGEFWYVIVGKAIGEGGAPGSITLQVKTVTPSTSVQTITADPAYDGLSKVTVNAMPTGVLNTPTISVSTAGVITATSGVSTSGYLASSATKSGTKSMTTKGAATITPGTSDQTIASQTYLTGTQTIKGDANLTGGNIKSGVSIFGVPGEYVGSGDSGGIDTSDATATAEDIANGATAYVNGEKITGNVDIIDGIAVGGTVGTYASNNVKIRSTFISNSFLRKGGYVELWSNYSNFGDATADDVAKGKFFTSAAGLMVEGTREDGGSSSGGIPNSITAGDTPVLASFVGKNNSTKNTPSDTGASVTIQHAGTYRFKIPAMTGGLSAMGGNATVYIYKNGTEVSSYSVGSSETTMKSSDIACEAGDVISVWSMAGGSSYSTVNAVTMGLIACVDWDNGF